jgi:putative hydrolase of the HAD superfamily
MTASYQEAAAFFKPPPRAVLFDAGFTLTFHDGARIAAYAALAGIRADAAALERAEGALRAELRETEGVTLRTHDDGGYRWHQHLYRRLLALAETPGDPERLDSAAGVILRQHRASNAWRRIGPGVREAVGRLRAAGLVLAVVSNSEGTIEQMLVEIDLRAAFDAVVDSAVVGVTKPDPRIFQIALDRLGVSPADAIMVGDSPSADIAGAEAAGLRAALIDPHGLYPWCRAPHFDGVPAFVEALLTAREGDGSPPRGERGYPIAADSCR